MTFDAPSGYVMSMQGHDAAGRGYIFRGCHVSLADQSGQVNFQLVFIVLLLRCTV